MADQATKSSGHDSRPKNSRPGASNATDRGADASQETKTSSAIDSYLESLDRDITAAMSNVDKELARLDLELQSKITDAVQQRLLENAQALAGIYRGPEGVDHYQQMIRDLSDPSLASLPSSLTPNFQLSAPNEKSPDTSTLLALTRMLAQAGADGTDDDRHGSDGDSQHEKRIQASSAFERRMEELRLDHQCRMLSLGIETNEHLLKTYEKIYGAEAAYTKELKQRIVNERNQLAQMQARLAALRGQGSQNQNPQQPNNPTPPNNPAPPPPKPPTPKQPDRSGPGDTALPEQTPPAPSDGQAVDPNKKHNPSQQPNRGGDARFVDSRDMPLVDVSERPQLVPQRMELARQLLEKKKINLGDQRDMDLLLKALYCVNANLLKALLDAGYTFAPGRYNVAQGMPDIHGRPGVSGEAVDGAGGIHHSGRKIVIRTWLEDGQLQLSVPTLMHEIGHALFDTLLANHKPALDTFREVYKAEKEGMHRDYFKSESEFFAETFAMFSLRPDELKAKFPQTYHAYRLLFPLEGGPARPFLGISGNMILSKELYFLNRDMRPALLEGGTPTGALEVLSRVEAINAARIERGISPESTIFFIDGEDLGVDAVIKQLGHELCMQRGQRAPFNELEGTITIDNTILSNPQALFKYLSGGLGAILYIPADLNVSHDHPFFEAYRNFCKKNNGMYHLAIANRGREATQFLEGLSDTAIHFPHCSIRLNALDRFKLVELTRRIAVQNGYTIPEQAVDKLLELIQLGGTYRDGYRIWQKIQHAYQRRVTQETTSPSDVNVISSADIESAEIVQERDPLSKLESQFALQEAALQKTKEIIALAKLGRDNPDPQPLALSFEGNPGTGKTSFARLFAQSLAANQVVDSAAPTLLTASELISMGANAAKKKFEEGKNGVIFIDEAHQLDPSNNPDGKRIIDLLIPLLTNPEYARTVFVFAGYPGKMDRMLSTDPGFRSRVQTMTFRDYTVKELRDIAQRNLQARNLICSEQTLDALMRRIDRMQRATENPGNARDVVKTIEDVLRSQAARLARLPADQVTDAAKRTIELMDVVDPQQVTPDSVMKEIEEKIPGNEKLKDFLRSVEKRVALNIKKGLPIYQNVPFEIALDGASGTGKTTVVAPLVTKFYASLGLIAKDTLNVKTGAGLVGRFLGQAAGEVQNAFTEAKGGALLIDEVSSITNAHSYSADAIKELLSQINANRSKPQTLLFVADYPENVNHFLAYDQGLGSRFRSRITIEKIATAGALAIINRIIQHDGCTFEAGAETVLEAKLNQLTKLPAFASGRDIENLCASLLTEADENSVISKSSVARCLEEFITEVKRRPPPKGASKASGDVGVATETATQRAPAEERKASAARKTRQEVLEAQNRVAKKFKDLANSDPEAMAKMIADPQSEYYAELGKELGIDAQEAFDTRAEVVAEIVQEQKEKKLKFDYDCPYCGQVNSMSCSFYSRSEMANPDSFQFSTEWLIENSKKPPYESEE